MGRSLHVLLKKSCCQKFRKIHWKTPAPESSLRKNTGLQSITLLK